MQVAGAQGPCDDWLAVQCSAWCGQATAVQTPCLSVGVASTGGSAVAGVQSTGRDVVSGVKESNAKPLYCLKYSLIIIHCTP